MAKRFPPEQRIPREEANAIEKKFLGGRYLGWFRGRKNWYVYEKKMGLRDAYKAAERDMDIHMARPDRKEKPEWVKAGEWRVTNKRAADPATEQGIRALKIAAQWEELAKQVLARGVACSKARQKEWVADHICISIEHIDPAEVPDAKCVGLLKLAQEQPQVFWNRFHSAEKAERSETQGGQSTTADGQDLEEVTESFMTRLVSDE